VRVGGYAWEGTGVSKFAYLRPMKIGILHEEKEHFGDGQAVAIGANGFFPPEAEARAPLNYYKETLVSCDCPAAQ